MEQIQHTIETLFSASPEQTPENFRPIFNEFINHLNTGRIRAAEFDGEKWQVHHWVKKGILLGFRYGQMTDYSGDRFPFFDKDSYPLQTITIHQKVRIVPGGSSIRSGAFLAPGVVIMPPAYINVGGYVDSDTMIDSHVLVGSCAQIGKRVHLSAGVQIGGVLEPIGARPVIIEDDVMVGGNCGIFEGVIVRRGAVLAAGTILTASIPVYDLTRQQILKGNKEQPLEIPENAVVIPGSRPLEKSAFARRYGLHGYCAIIVKYRDSRTETATALEDSLR
ncbi:MAG: 2,3,4,5-tetrahydropyridine-2,6-dicarboxylate N-succinyltransferase [Candidatus Marinimicrobia bacterium]|nr:2,3,4,5-tetrahydropyridine-2,6-dicarboxylate N-succinyltransferase [Candidatus Neomarinimicrobiota bacterium]